MKILRIARLGSIFTVPNKKKLYQHRINAESSRFHWENCLKCVHTSVSTVIYLLGRMIFFDYKFGRTGAWSGRTFNCSSNFSCRTKSQMCFFVWPAGQFLILVEHCPMSNSCFKAWTVKLSKKALPYLTLYICLKYLVKYCGIKGFLKLFWIFRSWPVLAKTVLQKKF